VAQANWTYDELVLAGALFVRSGWRELRPNNEQVIALSHLLRSLPIHGRGTRADPAFRSPGSVSRKLGDLNTSRPSYTKIATKGGKGTRRVIEEFIQHEAEMLELARTIEENARAGHFEALPPPLDEDAEDVTGLEGTLLTRLVRSRERDPKLRQRKTQQVLRDRGELDCEVCGFNFGKQYGPLGHNYIEVHHVTPLHVVGRRETTLADLACLCSNCHRMCHRPNEGERWRTPEALRREMRRWHVDPESSRD
jgi:5-methylcytosine-specific restriction protein A